MADAHQRITVLIADDHRAFGEALGLALEKEVDLEVLEVTADGATAAASAASNRPDVALIDLQMPDVDGLETSRRIRSASAETAVIILTGSEDELAIGRAIQAGAHGYLRKTVAIHEVADAVRRAHKREPLNPRDEIDFALRRLGRLRDRDDDVAQRFDRLTPRELQILQLLADGRASDDIATQLGVSRNTLRTHIQNVLTKLGVHSKLDAIVAAIRHGRVRTEDVAAPVDAAVGSLDSPPSGEEAS